VLNRVGEATLAQYAAARAPMDSPETACELWREVVAVDPCHEPDKEHLVAMLLNTELRMIGYHVVSVGSLNEALAHPREIFRAAILAGAYGLIVMHNHPSGDPTFQPGRPPPDHEYPGSGGNPSNQFCSITSSWVRPALIGSFTSAFARRDFYEASPFQFRAI
jgi:hypothetical protein